MLKLTIRCIAAKLSDITDPAARRDWAREFLGEVHEEVAGVIEQARQLLEEYRDASFVTTPQMSAHGLLAATLAVIDVPLQAMVVSVSFRGLPVTLSWVAGLVLVLVIAALAHGSVYGFVHKSTHALRAPRIAATWGGVFLVLFVIAAALGLITSRVWDAALARSLRGPAQLSILCAAEFGAIAGGLLGAAAWPGVRAAILRRRVRRSCLGLRQLLETGDMLAKDVSAESVEAEAWEALRTEAALVIAKAQAATRSPGARVHRKVDATPIVIALMAAGALNSGCQASAPADASVGEPIRSTQDDTNDGRTCGFLVDGTKSLDPEHRARAIGLLGRELESIIRGLKCSSVGAGVFADGGEWTGSLEYVSLPSVPESVACAQATPTIQGFDRILARNPAYRENLEQDAQRQCESRQARTDGSFAAELQPALARITAAFQAPAAGDATDLAGAVRAVLRPGGVVLAVTDGIQTVRRSEPFVLPVDALVVLLIAPTAAEYGGAKTTRTAADRWQKVDRVVVIPYPMLGDRGFTRKVAGLGSSKDSRRTTER